jgi:20S proteasome alpha/beta subunit
MTTGLAIKCINGIVLASDSQSSTSTTKLTVEKAHKIKSNMGLVGVGDFTQVADLVNFLKKNQCSESGDRFITEINSCLLQLHIEKNVPYLNSLSQILEDRFPFTPEFLIGATAGNNFHIYHGGFDEIGKFKCKTCIISE